MRRLTLCLKRNHWRNRIAVWLSSARYALLTVPTWKQFAHPRSVRFNLPTSAVVFGWADNPRFAAAKTVDDLNEPEITIAYFVGGGEEGWVKQRFPKAKLLGVSNSGATAPLEDIMAKRADAAPINRIPWVAMARKVKGLSALPHENNCQSSTEKAQPVGLAIDKNQPAFLDWLRATEKAVHAKLEADEERVVATMQ